MYVLYIDAIIFVSQALDTKQTSLDTALERYILAFWKPIIVTNIGNLRGVKKTV